MVHQLASPLYREIRKFRHTLTEAIRTALYTAGDLLAVVIIRCGYLRGLVGNLAVVYHLDKDSPELLSSAITSLRNAFHCYVDFVIDAYAGPDALQAAYELDPAGVDVIESHMTAGRGVILVAPHMCSLDIFALAISRRFADMQALTLSAPPLNSRFMNHVRSKYGMHVTPIDHDSLRAAIRRLRRGGLVGIAADVPANYGVHLEFFGQRCLLPIGHTRLAESTNAAVVVGLSHRLGPRSYRGSAMELPQNDMDEEQWAEAIIRVIEAQISRRPDEWFMTAPLWIDPSDESVEPILFQHRLPAKLTCRLIKR